MWQKLLNPEIQTYIKTHQNEDVAKLALKKPPHPDWPWPLILDQIKSRQKAAVKLPGWLTRDNMIFPPPATLEQASSTATANYKAAIIKAETFADLTGGTGADAVSFAAYARKGYIVEADEMAAAILARNLPLLSAANLTVIQARAEDALASLKPVDLIYIDPQRRTEKQRGLYKLEDCSPGIPGMMDALRARAKHLLIKTSPVLDIPKTLGDLPGVTHVYVVEWQGECKEVLYRIDTKNPNDTPQIHAVEIADDGTPVKQITFDYAAESVARIRHSDPLTYLYEPGPAFLKSGAFKTLAARYDLHKIAPSTHLYTSEDLCPAFPGRIFRIENRAPVHAKAVRAILPGLRANLTTRNFPLSTENLRKKLGLKDGGDDFLFACTLENQDKTIIHARKI